jgi:hypothetical protein
MSALLGGLGSSSYLKPRLDESAATNGSDSSEDSSNGQVSFLFIHMFIVTRMRLVQVKPNSYKANQLEPHLGIVETLIAGNPRDEFQSASGDAREVSFNPLYIA